MINKIHEKGVRGAFEVLLPSIRCQFGSEISYKEQQQQQTVKEMVDQHSITI